MSDLRRLYRKDGVFGLSVGALQGRLLLHQTLAVVDAVLKLDGSRARIPIWHSVYLNSFLQILALLFLL